MSRARQFAAFLGLAALLALAAPAHPFGLGDLLQNADKAIGVGKSVFKTGQAALKAAEELTPEQEYYLGRAVAASLLAKYPPLDQPAANRYLNLMGQSLALASTRPQTFGGYHFLILASDEVNAFGCPGGLILVTRGLLRCCQGEDEVAAVLAHEIGHVALRHGLNAIQQSRVVELGKILAEEGASHAGGNVALLANTFGGSIGDVTQTLLVSGYSRSQEAEADQAAAGIIKALGYDPQALIRVLTAMKARLQPGGLDFAKTHPDPADRIADLAEACQGQAPPAPPARQARYREALGGV